MKVGCLIYFFGKKYEKIGQCALNSFKSFHPDVDLIHVNESNQNDYESIRFLPEYGHGIFKYMLAAEIFAKGKYDKLMILGADTITCSRLDEFIDDNQNDVITTLDQDYQFNTPLLKLRYPPYAPGSTRPDIPEYECLSSKMIITIGTIGTNNLKTYYTHTPWWEFLDNPVGNYEDNTQQNYLTLSGLRYFGLGKDEALGLIEAGQQILHLQNMHYNADVVCFNSLDALKKIIKLSIESKNDYERHSRKYSEHVRYSYYGEQGGLNIFCSLVEQKRLAGYRVACADGPYHVKKVVYNTRAKNFGTDKYYVENNKLYTNDNKQIKVWHYGEGFGALDDKDFKKTINEWINIKFNSETKKFFSQNCKTGDFFKKELSF